MRGSCQTIFVAQSRLVGLPPRAGPASRCELGIGLLLIARISTSGPLPVGRPDGWASRESAALPRCPACGTPFDPAEYQVWNDHSEVSQLAEKSRSTSVAPFNDTACYSSKRRQTMTDFRSELAAA